ncbi:MAG: type II toxin-antitoxin system RelE/ParE family toxin [Parabacteroides sp.]|nr:type II toxin-antitoxin system RelE/ParE family toxin [Parabacteroides sp.]
MEISAKKIRSIRFYKNYFKEFYVEQNEEVRRKINYSMKMVETQRIIPKKFFRNIDGSDGIYEIRTEYAGNIYRILCCLDKDAIVVLFQGFQKKTQKTPLKEIQMAERLKKEYFIDKEEQ